MASMSFQIKQNLPYGIVNVKGDVLKLFVV
jgi:hypothetical protein